jgi:hypothetical protein
MYSEYTQPLVANGKQRLLAAQCCIFFTLRILHEGHTPAAEAASTEGQQQDTAITL